MESKMNQNEIQERMGSTATEQDAIAMMDLLTSNGYDLKTLDTTTIPDQFWLDMIEEAIAEYNSCGACDTVYRRETGNSRTSPVGVIDLCEDCNRRYVHYLHEHPATFSLDGLREYVRN
jgi:hypothetical protein